MNKSVGFLRSFEDKQVGFCSGDPMLFHYSYCRKTPFPKAEDSAVLKLFVCLTVPTLILEFCIHAAIFVKQAQGGTWTEALALALSRECF